MEHFCQVRAVHPRLVIVASPGCRRLSSGAARFAEMVHNGLDPKPRFADFTAIGPSPPDESGTGFA